MYTLKYSYLVYYHDTVNSQHQYYLEHVKINHNDSVMKKYRSSGNIRQQEHDISWVLATHENYITAINS